MPNKLTAEQKAIRDVEKKEYHRQYNIAHRAAQAEYARQWRANNPERCKEQDAEKRSRKGPYSTWSEEEKAAARAGTRRYREAHPERVRVYNEISASRRREKYRTDEVYREAAKASARQAMPEVQRTRRAKLKAQVFAHYGALCACCGETEDVFLTLDHVNDDGAAHRKGLSNGHGRSGGATARIWLDIIRRGFPPDFQILCYNCNCGRFRNGGICPHQRDKLMKVTLNTDADTGLLPVASPEVPTTAPGPC